MTKLKKGSKRMPRTKQWVKKYGKSHKLVIEKNGKYYAYEQCNVILMNGKRTTQRKYVGKATVQEYFAYKRKSLLDRIKLKIKELF